MDGYAQQSGDDSSGSHLHTKNQASAGEQLMALIPAANSTPTSHHPPEMQNTAPPSKTSAFLASLTAHYATRSDVVTPHLFTQHCKDYHTGKSNENGFYVSVYRLFCSTNAQHLMEGFKAFLPSAWKNIELGWLDRAVEEDVKKQAKESKELTASLVVMLEGSSTQSDSALLADTNTPATKRQLPEGPAEAVAGQPAVKKENTPTKAFRPPQRISSRLAQSSTTSPDTTPAPVNKTLRWLATQNQDFTTPPTKQPLSKTATPLTTKPTILKPASPATTTPGALPPASTIPHLGPIYRDKRHILSRRNKPYIHGLCGQHFGHPAEVQRHHNGQGGRPGCWEKKGKPQGEEGAWDSDATCKVRLTDVSYVRVKEGFVVTSWGVVSGVEGLREGEEDGVGVGVGVGGVGGEEDVEGDDGEAGEKRKGLLKLNVRAQVKGDSNAGEDGEDDDLKVFVASQSSPEPAEKLQEILETEDGNAASFEVNAAARAVALGLRTRK